MTSTTAQTSMILQHLRHDKITAIEALMQYKCFRLAARIKDLREAGHQIHTTMIETPAGKRIAEYSLIKEANQ